MYFTENETEKIMQRVPCFEYGGGFKVDADKKIRDPPKSYSEILKDIAVTARNPPFSGRLEKYIKKECEHMIFRNEKHRETFEKVLQKSDKNDYALLSALYLMTADFQIWRAAKHFCNMNEINFGEIKLKNVSENAYSLFCAAKDLYLGTKHFTVSELADAELIPQKILILICNAMAIRRFGLRGVEFYNE